MNGVFTRSGEAKILVFETLHRVYPEMLHFVQHGSSLRFQADTQIPPFFSGFRQVDFLLGPRRILGDGPLVFKPNPTSRRTLAYLRALRHYLPNHNKWRPRRRSQAGQKRIVDFDGQPILTGIRAG